MIKRSHHTAIIVSYELLNKNRKLKTALWAVFAISVYLILYKTIFNRPVDNNYPIKLEIFWELKQWITGNGFGKDIINNILLFVPFGITLGLIWGRWYVILTGFIFSLLVELSQLIFRIGWFELDDISNNTIGTALGFAVAVLIIKNFGMQEFMKNTKKEIDPLSDKSGGGYLMKK